MARSPIWTAADYVSMSLNSLSEAADLLQELQEHSATNRAAALHELLIEFHHELELLVAGKGPLAKAPDKVDTP